MNKGGVCNRTSNNKYFNCAARMDDGRHFTDYRPSSYVNDLIRYSNKVMSSYQYRQFLQSNATQLMKVNNKYTHMKNANNECNAVPVPFETICNVNKSYSTCVPGNCTGVGIKNVSQRMPPKMYRPVLQKRVRR